MASSNGIYKKYKVATNYFFDGVIKFAVEHSLASKKMKVSSLAIFEDLVNRISASVPAASLTSPGLLTALKACKYAIKLREETQLLYPTRVTTGDASDKHIYFMESMKRWYDVLRAVCASTEPPNANELETSTSSANPTQLTSEPEAYTIRHNTFDVLTDEEMDKLLSAAETSKDGSRDHVEILSDKISGQSGWTTEDIKKYLQEELFFATLCLFADLDSLYEKVARVWMDVKRQTVSVIAATTVTLTAIRFANQLESEFQLKYPALNTAELVYSACVVKMDVDDESWKASKKAWKNNRKPFEFHRGSLWFGFKFVASLLETVGNSIPENSDVRKLPTFPQYDTFGPSFHEDRCLLAKANDADSTFIMREVIKLKNFYYFTEEIYLVYDETPDDTITKADQFFKKYKLLGVFVNQFKPLFEKKRATLSMAFTMCCWLKSVHTLQGQKFITRTFSLAKFTGFNISDMVKKAFDGCTLSERSEEAAVGLRLGFVAFQTESGWIQTFSEAFITNAIMSGALMLEYTLKFLEISVMTMFTYSNRVRITCQVYHAMRERQLIEAIPVLENVITAVGSTIFGASKPTQGNFVANLMLQSNYTPETVRRMIDHSVPYQDPRGGSRRARSSENGPGYTGNPGSIVYEVLMKSNFNDIPNIRSMSMTMILDTLKDIAMREQFDPSSRVLGLSFLSVNRASYNFLHNLHRINRIADDQVGPEIAGAGLLMALDSTALLNRMNLDASGRPHLYDAAVLENQGVRIAILAAEMLRRYFCPKPLVSAQFKSSLQSPCSTTGVVFAEPFHFLPDYVNAHTVEFGDHKILHCADSHDANLTETRFCIWMDRFEDEGVLKKERMLEYVDMIKSYPYPLTKFSPEDKLCSHLHHAAAGVVKDRRLFEFLVQMGANETVSILFLTHHFLE